MDPLTAMLTSGSTGLPKPRWITADNWLTRNPQGTSIKPVRSILGKFSAHADGECRGLDRVGGECRKGLGQTRL